MERLTLGSRCAYLRCRGKGVTEVVHCTVAGTWAFVFGRRIVLRGYDPATDSAAHGYLLEPTCGGTMRFALFGDLATGALRPRPHGHTVGAPPVKVRRGTL